MQTGMINEAEIKRVVTEVIAKYQAQTMMPQTCAPVNPAPCASQDNVEILVEASGRHVHLSEADIERLFGKGYKLTPKKNLSQIGQFACEERVTLIGPKNIYRNVAILGPARKETQVEISLSDAKFLGVDAPIKMSGDLRGAADIIIATDKESIAAKSSVIVAQNHIHMTPAQANQWGFCDGQVVSVSMRTARPITFDNAVIRVSETAGLAMHIDFDEANACAFKTGDTGVINCSGPNTGGVCVPKDCSCSKPDTGVAIKKKFITEEDIRKALKNTNSTSISIPHDSMVSALAKDYANKEKITLVFI